MAWRLMSGSRLIAKAVSENGKVYMDAIPDVGRYTLPIDLFKLGKRRVTMLEFIEWASDRCFPEERLGAEELLKELGLDHYDGWEIVKITKAKLMTDPFWIDS